MTINKKLIEMITHDCSLNEAQCQVLEIDYPQKHNWNSLILNKEILEKDKMLLFLLKGNLTKKEQKLIKDNHSLLFQFSEENSPAFLLPEIDQKIQDLQNKLNEKELLLREVNHRIKNNMQVIMSLLKIEEDVNDEYSRHKLISIENKLTAMSYLHELLEDNILEVNALAYFERLGEGILTSYESNIPVIFDIKVDLYEEDALFCGLILNEIVTNSIKHAFPIEEGKIQISLHKIKGTFILIIKDNGVGFNLNKKTNSQGLLLVEALAKSLKGIIKIDVNDGVEVTISWSNEKN